MFTCILYYCQQMLLLTPLEINSNPIMPDPENKSRTFNPFKFILLEIILKRLSFAISVVGLIGKPLEILILLPLNFPEIILIKTWLIKY